VGVLDTNNKLFGDANDLTGGPLERETPIIFFENYHVPEFPGVLPVLMDDVL
jgi:hypothetical protein